MARRPGIIVTALAAMVLAATVLAGVAASQDRNAESMDFVRERVRADKKAFIAQNLTLTEPEGKAFWPVYDRFQSELLDLQERMFRLVGDYITVYPNLSNAKARELVDEMLVLDVELAKLRQVYAPRFRQALPDTKVARYYQLENKIRAVGLYEAATRIPIVK
jgi:hypothetical protein